MSDFVHLHCHSEYSLLDGAIRIRDLCARAKDMGMEAVAITDHGNLFGSLRFYLEARKLGLKPIIGCEMYVTAAELGDRESSLARTRYHLILLAQNLKGYQNLVKLVSIAHLRGFYSKPRVNMALLSKYNEGLIAMSACLAGEVPRQLLQYGLEAAEKTARQYAEIFPGRFFLEIQSNGLKEQETLNQGLIELSAGTGLPLAATNDCHYLSAEDVDAHEILLCIQTATTLDDPKRMRFETRELYYKSPEEMENAFAHVPEALENTGLIANMCELELELGKAHFPVYSLPENRSIDKEFEKLCRHGLKERLAKLPYQVEGQVYQERLDHEIEVIRQMGFSGYFLIVQDFINWAKGRSIPVGPGRGSAAGSLVAFALKITNLDPVRYNLLFERFLNQERVSLPDIDVDFCERRRNEVIRYVCERYGEDSVAQITTFGTMKAKAVVRDVGRALGMSFAETDKIAKLIPGDLKMTIAKALELEPELGVLSQADSTIAKLLDISMRLEGLSRHASTHAAGLVISDRPLDEYLPLYRGKRDEVVTQLDMKMVEKIGLIKFDFLGLRNMTMIQDTLDLIQAQGRTPPDLDALPLDDPAVYALYSRADTDGVFQVESSGMRRYLRQLKPNCFDDIIAMLALYRPGPLGSGMVEQFIRRKQGEEKVLYPVQDLEPILKDTYGVIVYQEQVMKIAQVVAGYTLGGADLLRRAMGKKDRLAMTEQRAKFLEGAANAGLADQAKAVEIFDLMEKFAEYGFNKSHSAAYALISYYTAYLKVHYPAEFMAALMSSENDNQDKLLIYLNSCRDMGLAVLPPDVNAGQSSFVVRDGAILFGLSGVKNVGREAIEEIIAKRDQDGSFTSLLDLCCRVNSRKVGKRVLDSLIKSGSLDCFGCSRAALDVALEEAMSKAQKKSRAADAGQASLFNLIPREEALKPGVGWDGPEKDTPEWDDEVKLTYEKESLGFFLSSHPLLPYRETIKRNNWTQLAECRDKSRGTEVETAVIITGHKDYINRKGERMAFCQIEDLTATAEIVLFADFYQTARGFWEADRPVLIRAIINGQESGDDGDDESLSRLKMAAKGISLLEEAVQRSQAVIDLDLSSERLAKGGVKSLRELLLKYKGNSVVRVRLNIDGTEYRMNLGAEFEVAAGPAFERAFREWKEQRAAGS